MSKDFSYVIAIDNLIYNTTRSHFLFFFVKNRKCDNELLYLEGGSKKIHNNFKKLARKYLIKNK